MEQADILQPMHVKPEDYKESDVFAWANNIVRLKDELKIDIFLFNKIMFYIRQNLQKRFPSNLSRFL